MIYGLVADQLCGLTNPVEGIPGDGTPQTVSEYMEKAFGYTYTFRGW